MRVAPLGLVLFVAVLVAAPAAAQGGSPSTPPLLLRSVQEETALGVSPGDSATTRLHFVNEGRVPLYILLTPSRVPPGWNLSVEPPVGTLPGKGFQAAANLRLEPGQRARATLVVKAGPGASPSTLQVDAAAADLSEEGGSLVTLYRAFAYNLSPGPGPSERPNETVVAGLSGYPIRFGYILPGRTGNASPDAGFPVRVRVLPGTTVRTTVAVRGTDFAAGELSFPASQMSLSPDSGASGRVPLATTFQSLLPGWASLDAGREQTREAYFWLQIPERQPPGAYANTVAFAVSREGLLPLSTEALRVEPLPSPSPTPAPPAPTPTPRQPGFELLAALGAVAVCARFARAGRRT